MVRMRLYILSAIAVMLVLVSCDLRLRPGSDDDTNGGVKVERYDRLESRYLTTADFSALQQMDTKYPVETRTLIEDVLKIGEVNDPKINQKFLKFFQDSTLQTIINDAEVQYADVEDINESLTLAFSNMEEKLPEVKVPKVYMQIGALNQSIIIGEGIIGISLDKYLGENYPIYQSYYNEQQRRTMNRSNIVPDAVMFYLLGNFPLQNFEKRSQTERDVHLSKILYAVNLLIGSDSGIPSDNLSKVEKYMKKHADISLADFLTNENLSEIAALK